ncbi:MAG: PAS domain S-box protein [Bryobacteraceae bacterium]|jgi:PAS domain S-box-containing protein
MSLPRTTGALCGALAILLGLLVLVGWIVHSNALDEAASGLPPMQHDAAIGFVLSGLALLGTVFGRRRFVFVGSALTVILAGTSLLGERMSPASALCFTVMALGLLLAQISPIPKPSSTLGLAGFVVAAIAASCGISVIWGGGDAFGLGDLTRMTFPTAAGFLLLGIGAVAVALDMSQAELRQPVWASIGAGFFLVIIRIGLLRAFSPERQTGISSALALLGALFGAAVFGVFVHLALKAHLQRDLLRRAERAAHAANEQLEQRVEERTRAIEEANDELRKEIARRERVEGDLRQQKEILQTIFDHVPVILRLADKDGRTRMVNPQWERVLGSKAEPERRDEDSYQEYYTDIEERRRALDFVANATSEWADFKTKLRDGRVIDTSWAVVRLSDEATIRIGQDISERKQAEQELRKQKEILQSIFDHIPVMINFGDGNYELKLVNREWERTLGWSLEDIQRDNVDILTENYPDPHYREQVRKFVMNSNGEWADFKTTVRDGRVIDTSWAMLHLADGTSMGIGQDITRRKRAEEALRESEERFRQLAENIHDLFWIKTPDFKRVLYLSPAYQRISGRSPEERYRDPDYQPFLNTIHPEDREKMAQIMKSGAGTEFDIEFRILHADGSMRWIRDRGFPIRDQSGKVYRIAGIANDITERRLAEEALRESEERFRQLADNIREVFWLRSPDFKQLLYVSPMYEKVCGRSCESLYSAGPDFVGLHPDDRAWLMEMTPRLAEKEFEIEYRIVTQDGDIRWLRDRGFPIRNPSGKVYRIGGVAEDITDRKEAEDRLKASSEQLRALSANLQSAREQEAARIAHQIHDEMGGILTGLRWELEAMKKMIDEPADAWPLKAVMQAKLATMLGLTDSTLNVVRRIASELRPSILDDLGLMEAVEWQTEQFQARTGIECRCHCSLPSIPLDEVQSTAVFRILQEALTNIIRHAQATRVAVAMMVENEMFTVTVTDNGRGITPEEMRSRNSLGLLGMQERAHLIGGRVDIVGLKGTGTTLHVLVPLARAESAGAM